MNTGPASAKKYYEKKLLESLCIYTHRNVHDFNPDLQDIVTSDTTACTTISVRQQKPEFLCGFGDDCKTLFTVPTNCSNAQQGQTSIFNFHSKLFIRENTLSRKRSGKNDHQPDTDKH